MVNLTVCQKKSLSLKKANININLLELTEDNMIQMEKQIKKDFNPISHNVWNPWLPQGGAESARSIILIFFEKLSAEI